MRHRARILGRGCRSEGEIVLRGEKRDQRQRLGLVFEWMTWLGFLLCLTLDGGLNVEVISLVSPMMTEADD